jgi:hypothetical protein
MQSSEMRSNVQKTAMPIVAGILSIVSGALKLIGILVIIFASFFLAVEPSMSTRIQHPVILLSMVVIVLAILGVLGVVGGVYMLKRKNFGLSLAGSIAAFLPFNLLGLAAIILLALSKKEFE